MIEQVESSEEWVLRKLFGLYWNQRIEEGTTETESIGTVEEDNYAGRVLLYFIYIWGRILLWTGARHRRGEQ